MRDDIKKKKKKKRNGPTGILKEVVGVGSWGSEIWNVLINLC